MIKKILLIEDNSDLRSTIEDYFSAKSNGEIIIKARQAGRKLTLSTTLKSIASSC